MRRSVKKQIKSLTFLERNEVNYFCLLSYSIKFNESSRGIKPLEIQINT